MLKMKIKDEWNVIVTNKYIRGDSGVSMETIVIPGFTSKELADEALSSITSLCKHPYDYSNGVVVKVKEYNRNA